MKVKRMFTKNAVAMATISVLLGCSNVPENKVADFSQSATNMLEHVSGVVSEYNQAKSHRDLTHLAAKYNGSSKAKLNSDEFEPLATYQLPENSPIIAISKALLAYSKALNDLASANNEADAELAALHLYQAAESSQWVSLPIPKEKEGIAQSALVALVGSYSEDKKQRALKKVITNSDAIVSQLSIRLVELIEEHQIGTAIYLSRSYVLSEEVQDFNRRANIRQMPLKASRDEIERLYAQWEEMAATPILIQQTIKAIDTFRMSHNQVAESLNSGTLTKATLVQSQARMKDVTARFNTTKGLLENCEEGVEVVDSKLSCKGQDK
ncbi:hypothetical protein CW749_15000 [Vibrio sp. vnigr-6D03]|uniref:hypothetical protein n=1 Tax=Vibrio sp. vnigr-6D03 TaxID=2058088 RepID=UPI000C346396|nr:hypothetical protein [Vibrio sp. vnigr-6D03]PKF78840.1 hypothetical protein CW749_15000 [Vibrio sp. vnigr-6D03]